MKKLISLIICLVFPLVLSCQSIHKLSYGLNIPILQLNGTTVSSTAVQLNYLNTMTGNVKTALDSKQAILVSGVNLCTIGGHTLLDGTDISVSGTGSVTILTGTNANGIIWIITNPTSTPNLSVSLGTITPTSVNGIVFSGSYTPRLTVTGTSTISSTNTGDNAVNSLYAGIESNFTHTGDVTGNHALTIANNVVTLAKMANMATSSLIYRRTTGIGVPEVNTLAQLKTDLLLTGTNSGDQTNITGNAGTATLLQNARLLNGVSFNGSTNVTIPSNITATVDGYVMTAASGLWTSAPPASVTISARVDSIVAVLKDTIPLADVAVLKHATITSKTSSYVLQLADDGTTITMNVTTANTLTVPLNSVPFPIGTIINIECIGAGKTTVVATSGVTIISKGSYLGITVLGDASLHKLGTNTWKLIGSLE